MAWSAPRTWVATNVLTAAQLNTDVRDNMLWLGTRKGFKIRRVANQAITTATLTAVSFDTEDSDTDAFGAVTATTYTIPTGLDGLYAITANVIFGAAAGTTPYMRVIAGGVVTPRASWPPPTTTGCPRTPWPASSATSAPSARTTSG